MNNFKKNIYNKNKKLSKFATLNKEAIRLYIETDDYDDIRSPFFRDIDRILFSLAYTRYLDKTQVFTYQKHDHITKRMVHVQYVSKIARTIGRALKLNEDLIEAAALGHDLGHVPFGHTGEMYLNELSLKYGQGYFKHNIQSVRVLKDIEKYGNGLNVTYQVLDAIMCHNGEILEPVYKPKKKTKEEFLKDYELSYREEHNLLVPSTLEGCVVRISDLIGYIGRDIEDGIRLKLLKESDIPKNITKVLGSRNKDIINTIILDILNNSYNKNYIKLSDDVYKAVNDLKSFNYKNIYYKAYTKEEFKNIKEMFNTIFDYYLKVLKEEKKSSSIFTSYLKNMSDEYKNNTNERIVLDYIAGMTDEFFINKYNIIKDIK